MGICPRRFLRMIQLWAQRWNVLLCPLRKIIKAILLACDADKEPPPFYPGKAKIKSPALYKYSLRSRDTLYWPQIAPDHKMKYYSMITEESVDDQAIKNSTKLIFGRLQASKSGDRKRLSRQAIFARKLSRCHPTIDCHFSRFERIRHRLRTIQEVVTSSIASDGLLRRRGR